MASMVSRSTCEGSAVVRAINFTISRQAKASAKGKHPQDLAVLCNIVLVSPPQGIFYDSFSGLLHKYMEAKAYPDLTRMIPLSGLPMS